MKKALVWLRKDLRFQQNQIFHWLMKNPDYNEVLVLVSVPTFRGAQQQTFFWQSVLDLKEQLEQIHVSLFAISGDAIGGLKLWSDFFGPDVILGSQELNSRDDKLQEQLREMLSPKSVLFFDQITMLDPKSLPFEIQKMPDQFTAFKNKVEKSPLQVLQLPEITLNAQPAKTVRDLPPALLKTIAPVPPMAELPYGFEGGERAAQKHLKEYIWEKRSLLHYKDTRNGMIVKSDSSKLSPWLAWGCLAPQSVYHQVKDFEEQVEANDSTYWLIYELLWRDYFKFLAVKYQDLLFSPHGLYNKHRDWNKSVEDFERWRSGDTGVPFIDAHMTELQLTGWMSNRGRQNVASFLCKTLNINWQLGAQWFAEQLIDHDLEVNIGNWLYLSGLGTDPRDRLFNVSSQAQHYDPENTYTNHWLNKKAELKK